MHELAIRVDCLIGDMDSIQTAPELHTTKEIKRFNRDKDFSDSELALRYALDNNATHIELHAVLGDYPDHSLANMFLLKRYYSPNAEVTIITAKTSLFLLNAGEKILKNFKDRRVSLFFLDDIKGLQMDGFRYSFASSEIEAGDFSLSNVIADSQAKISCAQGAIIIMLFDGGYV